jgi:hypothetical protein
VQSSSSVASAVAIQWMATNAMGEIGKLVVIQQYSYLFDSFPKSSKLAGEFCCVTGNFLHLMTLFFPQHYLLLASFGYMLYGIYLSIWSATHTTFNNNLALKENNMGDLNAKEDAQVSLAHLLGVLCGIGLLSIQSSSSYLLVVYIISSSIQVLMTVMLVNSAKYEVMNFNRMRLLCHALVQTMRTLSCHNIQTRENWLGEFLLLRGLPSIRLAYHVKDALKDEWISERLQICNVRSQLLIIERKISFNS